MPRDGFGRIKASEALSSPRPALSHLTENVLAFASLPGMQERRIWGTVHDTAQLRFSLEAGASVRLQMHDALKQDRGRSSQHGAKRR